MYDWERYYVVCDGKRKKHRSSNTDPLPRAKKKTWKRWLKFAFFMFFVGLALGLVENQEAERYVDSAQTRISRVIEAPGVPSQKIWKRAIRQYEIAYTDHFMCRMECRDISRPEVWSALHNGAAVNEFINDDSDYPKQQGEIKYTVLGQTELHRQIKTVLAVNTKARLVTFITTMDVGIDRGKDPCGENTCKGRPRN